MGLVPLMSRLANQSKIEYYSKSNFGCFNRIRCNDLHSKSLRGGLMSVGEFDPASIEDDLSDELIHRLCALVEDEKVNLSNADQQRYATLVKHKDWANKATLLELQHLRL